MTREFVKQARRWHRVELLMMVTVFLILAAAIYVQYAGISLRLSHELLALTGLACALVGWYLSGATVANALRQASVQGTLEARQEFDSLYARSPIAYLTIDPSGRVERANPAAVHLFEDTIADITTRNVFEFVRSEESDTNEAILRGKIAAGMTVTDLELPITTVAGTPRYVLVNVFAGTDAHERLIAVTDITDQRAVDTAKSEFVALATHQLRTPIAAIRWNVELLVRTLKDTQTEKQAKYLEKINRNVLRMLHLINDFLSVSKLEMGTYAAEPEVVTFIEYLGEIMDEFEEKITTKQLDVQTQVQPEGMRVAIDRRLFHIISSNLISNAVKYTPEGGTVTVSATAQSDTFVYQVSDTGIGVPAAEQPELFAKFFRASNAQSTVTEGTGLGLYVVKQSVEILGGTLEVESVENEGTTFTITLPGIVR